MRKSILPALTVRQLHQTCVKALLVILITTTFASRASAQDALEKPVSLTVNEMEITKVISLLETQVKVKFMYSPTAIRSSRKISCAVTNKKLRDFLADVFSPLDIGFKINNGQVVLYNSLNQSTASLNGAGGNASGNFMPEKSTITGTVKDDKGAFLPGVSVSERGTNNTTTTNEQGSFLINTTSASPVLVFSFSGFVSKQVVVGGQTSINTDLVTDTKGIEEVIVVGYGRQKKINNTGAISSIGTKELIQSPVANISNSLVGRLPGLFATQSGGEPGNDASKIRIRGIGTFSGNTDPLALVDGIEVANYNNIDPNEIETVTILKDASSTAVYGIRGANGVIIITTKRGKIGPPKISYTYNKGFNSFTDQRQQMNSFDYATHFNDALKADAYVTGSTYVPRYTPTDLQLYKDGTDPVFHPSVNWPDVLFKKVSGQSQHNISVSGGQRKIRYFISAGFFNQEGLFKDTKEVTDAFSPQSIFRRYNIRSNFNFELTRDLKMSLDLSSQTETRNSNNGTNTERVVGDIFRASPLSTPGVINGKVVNIFTGAQNNPYASLLYPNLAGGVKRSYRNYLNGALRFDYDFSALTKGLTAHGNVSIQTYNDQQIVNTKTLITYLAIKLPDGTVNLVPSTTDAQFNFSQSGTYYRRITAEAGIDYKRSFGSHNVTALLLYNQQKTYDPSLAFLVPKGYQSYVGRVTYDYNGRYLAEVNVGYNGTENFAPGKRFGFFPAYSVGWVASNESFFPKHTAISLLKFRASYGEVGNDNIGGSRFLYRPTSYGTVGSIYYFGNVGTTYAGFTGLREGATGNPDVTWERAIKRDIGVEMNLFRDKLRISADVYDERRSDILSTPQTISSISGLSQPATNLGRMKNKGIEGEATYTDMIGKFGYRISANGTFARNKLLFRDEIPNQYAYQNRTGQRLGQNFAIIADGIYNTWEEVNNAKRPVNSYVANNRVQPGDVIYRDVNGDGIINDFDQVPVGYSNLPEIVYGLSLGGNYKGFDISVLFQGVGNVSLYYTRFQKGTGYGQAPPEGSPSYFTESWTQERYDAGLPIRFPRFSVSASPNNNSSFWLADASYLRIKNVEVGYTVRRNMLRKLSISSMRLYANANNLYTWKHVLPGIDPENTSTGDTNTEPYPLVRTINVGLNVNF